MKIIKRLKEDKLISFLLILVIILGIFIRFNDFTEVSFWNDDMSTVPSGILWFYPHSYFPGLSGNAEPQLGNILIGLGCITSGEDFSRISEIQPGYYPGRPALIADPLIKSELNCHIPVYIFGLLFFIAIILLALNLFDRYASLYIISFFAFFPQVLVYSRWIHVDILMWFFIILGYYFLYKAYISEKYSKKENLFFILAFSLFALSIATKFTGLPFFIFGLFILSLKYKDEIFSYLKKHNKEVIESNKEKYMKILSILAPSLIASVLLVLLPFKFSFKNLNDVLKSIRSIHNPYNSGVSLHFNVFSYIRDFLIQLNVIDMIIFLFSIFIIYKLIRKEKTIKEKFILYLVVFYFISIFLFNALEIFRLAIPYTFGLVFLMGLTFSDNEYSLINIINKNKKRIIFSIIMLVYIIYSFTIAFSGSPYFLQKNPLECTLNKDCRPEGRRLYGFSTNIIAEELNKIMKDNETFFPGSGILFYYIRSEDDIHEYRLNVDFQRQTGQKLKIVDYLNFYRPNGRFPRYLLLDPYYIEFFDEEERLIKQKIKPKVIVKNRGHEIVYIYDVLEFTRFENEQ